MLEGIIALFQYSENYFKKNIFQKWHSTGLDNISNL